MIKTTFNANPITPRLLWRIYYYDPRNPEVMKTFTNLDGTPGEAPKDLVLCILTPTAGGDRFELTSADLYFVDNEGKWSGSGIWGIEDRDRLKIPYENVKRGYWVNADRWNSCCSQWAADTDFPIPRIKRIR